MAEQLAWIIPVVLSIASASTSAVRASQAKVTAKHESQRQRAAWEQMSKPDPAALQAMATQSRGQLGQARLGSYQNLAANLAARGFGSGSGLAAQGAQDIERGYLQSLGQSATELTKFGLTPQFAPPGGAFGPTGQVSTAGAIAGKGENLMDTALGWTMMKSLYGTPTGQTNIYDYGPSRYYTEKYGGGW